MSKIIGIAGISGAGKTTLVKAVGKALNATCVYWDDYDEISTGPKDYVSWYETSRDYSAWHYPSLENVLSHLKEDKIITCPATHKELMPTPVVLFDAPLGYKHSATGKYIDALISLDVPLDIALGRRILRDFTSNKSTKEDIVEDIRCYLTHSRKLFEYFPEKEGAQLIINGNATIEEQVKFILSYLKPYLF